MLASKPTFFVKTSPEIWHKVDLHEPKMLREFEFKAQFDRPGCQTSVMRVSANPKRATVVIETSDGSPYSWMCDNTFIFCDPVSPGGLALCEDGATLWGVMQDLSLTNITFKTVFLGTNLASSAIFDLRAVIEVAMATVTNVSYAAKDRSITLASPHRCVEVFLSQTGPEDPFGIIRVRMSAGGATLDISDFKIAPASMSGLQKGSPSEIHGLGIPVRKISKDDLALKSVQSFVPSSFPNTPMDKQASDALLKLINSRMEK